jgi:rod shape-determining protein MreC
VLLISDPSWGAGAILTASRLQGIVKGTQSGNVQLQYIMADEQVKPGDSIITSGGDRIFPKGFPVGTISEVKPGRDNFLEIKVKPAADLNRLEEVLVITKITERAPDVTDAQGTVRAADILAERLPSVPQKPPEDQAKEAASGPGAPTSAQPNTSQSGAPGATTTAKPIGNANKPAQKSTTPVNTPASAPKPSGTNAAPQTH